MNRWDYVFDGEVITTLSRDDVPYLGYPVTFVGRLGKPAPAEHFVVTAVDEAARVMVLERANL
jgi:hypothetical protein